MGGGVEALENLKLEEKLEENRGRGGIQHINLRKITLFFDKEANQVLNVAKMNVLTYQSSNSIIISWPSPAL